MCPKKFNFENISYIWWLYCVMNFFWQFLSSFLHVMISHNVDFFFLKRAPLYNFSFHLNHISIADNEKEYKTIFILFIRENLVQRVDPPLKGT